MIHRAVLYGIGVLCLALACTSRGEPHQALDDERLVHIAEVNGNTISVGLFKKTYVEYLSRTGANDTVAQRYLHLQALVDAYLLGEHAIESGYESDSLYHVYMARQRKKALGGRYYEVNVLDKIQETPEEEQREAFIRFNDKVHLRHLFFRREADALEAYRRLEEGEGFVDLANDVYNTAVYDSSAGDLGIVSYFGVDDAFAEAAFTLEEQYEYTKPVRSRVGYHIVRLENKYSNPLLTESAFQMRREGIGQDVRLRKMRMSGDAFVREYMESLNYDVQREAIVALKQAIDALEYSVEPQPFDFDEEEGFGVEDVEMLQVRLTPETVLVEYDWKGERRTFTAGDYYGWLEELPFAEATANPAASVGRALRNEVLGLAGEEEGLYEDPIVKEAIQHEAMVFLARNIKSQLRQDTTSKPTPEMLDRAFERIAKDRRKSIIVDFWVIPFDRFEEAQQVLALIKAGEERPDSFQGYQAVTGHEVLQDREWMVHLRQAPLDRPVLAGLSNNRWFVIEVSEREEQVYTIEDVRDQLEQQLAPLASEHYVLKDLYQLASIEVDTLRVEQLVQ